MYAQAALLYDGTDFIETILRAVIRFQRAPWLKSGADYGENDGSEFFLIIKSEWAVYKDLPTAIPF